MLHLSGGPGGATYIDAETIPFWLQNFEIQNWGIDFVLYDQRGTGMGQPFLDCPDSRKARLESLKLPLNASQDSSHFNQQMHECHEKLAQNESTLKQLGTISTKHSAEDIADLHELLGVKQWILMGVSYGTRLALDTVKRFPGKVHSMILDSVYPPKYDGFESMVENGFKGIDRLLNRCEKDTACDKRFPDLAESLRQALFQLADEPLELSVPRENDKLVNETLSLTAHRLILLLDYASYDASLLPDTPAAIDAVWAKDKEDKSLLALASNYLEIELFLQFSEPVFMITECKENGRFDISQLMERFNEHKVKYPMLDWSTEAIFDPQVCKGWLDDLNQASQPYREQVTTDKSVLILSGGLDSITPPEWGEELAKDMTNARYLEYPNAGHSVLTSSLCANDEVQLFLNPSLKETTFCNAADRIHQLTDEKMQWTPR